MSTPKFSFCRMPPESLRISLAIMRSGWESQLRAETYKLSSSKNTQASVLSVLGSPSLGSCWTNPVIGRIWL